MKIKGLSKFDTVSATVVFRTRENGVYLEIDGLEEAAVIKAYDFYGSEGCRVLASVQKIDTEKCYIRLMVDSIMYADSFAA